MAKNDAIRHLLGARFEAFSGYCADLSWPAYRAKQVFEWVYGKGAADFSAMTNLSKAAREELAEQWVVYTSTLEREQRSTDGTVKLLLQWPDRATSECVLIPDGRRQTACVSSQVGCPVRCTFCASGMGGLQRQLTAGEIVEQVMRIRQQIEPEHRLSNLVFMGLGEPLANYEALVKAIGIINADWGVNLGARKITVSTIGLPSQIRRLARENLQIHLAISLHGPTDELRRKLIPWAKNVSIDELIDAGRAFFDATGREITLEYLLLGGVNDQLEQANELVRICRRMRCNVNVIRYNPVAGLSFKRPGGTEAHYFVERLRSRGVNVHVRKSRGLDIDAACGQLRRRHRRQENAD